MVETKWSVGKGIAIAALLLCVLSNRAQALQQAGPALLTYEELVQLYDQETPAAPLQQKLTRLLTTPFLNNQASDLKPIKPPSPALGSFLRVAFWNIERGLELDAIKQALTDTEAFAALLKNDKYRPGSRRHTELLEQIELLRQADVIVLNEVDWGLRRTGYRHVTAELAEALGMNYAFGVEFVEVDPLALGSEQFEGAAAEEQRELIKYIQVDPIRYRGLHGTAILSRYRLENVRLIPFQSQGHDWYADEKKDVALVETGKRSVGEAVFLEKVRREVRRGGRMMLLAEIAAPELPTGRALIVATHLEARTKPRNRVKQLEEMLAHIKESPHSVIVAGDMNTSTRDMTPTSFKREIQKRVGSEKFWVMQGIKYVTGIGLLLDVAFSGINFSRRQADPTVDHIWIVATNPEAKFFEVLEKFRFSDGGAFDFRGEEERTANGRAGTLANSNERGLKGFVTTHQVARTIGPAGKFKLDWIFVKPPAPLESEQTWPHRFAPHFGRTLTRLNKSVEGRLSDHHPITVDLPLNEPPLR